MYKYKINSILLLLILHILSTMCAKTRKRRDIKTQFDNLNSSYAGEKFPSKYLVPEVTVPTKEDLHNYMNGLAHTLDYFLKRPNKSDCNVGLGAYFTRAILRKTLLENRNKDYENEKDILLLVQAVDYLLSHYLAINKVYGWYDAEFRVSYLYRDDSPQVHSIKNFNRHKFLKWILSNNKLNGFEEAMDDLSLPKEQYIVLVEAMPYYFIGIDESDECLSRISYNPEPITVDELRPCRTDKFCMDRLHTSPSVSYALSHRLLNIMLSRHSRRCYWKSEEEDDEHMDLLCASMYREAVYIARRGFFARDLFLEHIALCAMLGYEEFNRPSWFKKSLTWMDEDGCIKEDFNYDLNRTDLLVQRAGGDRKEIKKIKQIHRKIEYDECHEHPMALLLIVLSHAIRHAVHFIAS